MSWKPKAILVLAAVIASSPAPVTHATTPKSPGPIIQVFYGDIQTFGDPGLPQRWVNILGNVSPLPISALTFSLNGQVFEPLTIGPDGLRLRAAGDFNVEIDYRDLQPGPNEILIRARDSKNRTTERTVTIDYRGDSLPTPDYTIDWSTLGSINDRAHVVDGVWAFVPDGIQIQTPSYDRLVAVGDFRWGAYEITVPFTVHSGSGSLGVILGWNGHTNSGAFCPQPHCGWLPAGNSVWYNWLLDHPIGEGGAPASIGGGTLQDPAALLLEWGRRYVFKIRNEGQNLYHFKVWPEDETEPYDWTDSGIGDSRAPEGAALLVAHFVDATFGDVRFAPLPDVDSPSQPALPTASGISASRIDLTWPPVSDNLQVTEYKVYRDGLLVGSTGTNSFADVGLEPLTEYEYFVVALDDSENESPPSLSVSASTSDSVLDTCDPTGYGTDLNGGTLIHTARKTCYLYEVSVDCAGHSSGAQAKLMDANSNYAMAMFVLYDDDGSGGEPRTLLAESQRFHHDLSRGTPIVIDRRWASELDIQPGNYWLGACFQSPYSEFYGDDSGPRATRRDVMASWSAGPRATWRAGSDNHNSHPNMLAQLVFTGECADCPDPTCGASPTYLQPCISGSGACAVAGLYVCDDPESTVEAPHCDAISNPPRPELCGDVLDNDCDGSVDEDDAIDATIWYRDADGDTFGDPTSPRNACSEPAGFVSNSEDCDDLRADVRPGAVEVCGDGIDNDCDGSIDPPTCVLIVSAAKLESVTVTAGSALAPASVSLQQFYESPVIACTPVYDLNSVPVVVRVDNVTSGSFDVFLQNPGDLSSVVADTVNCLVVEEGSWLIDGHPVDAVQYTSSITDRARGFTGALESLTQSFTNPVVLGQVMSVNDPRWSVYWQQGATTSSAPTGSALRTGKMVAEDLESTRNNETIGYVVFERGRGSVGGVDFEAGLGADIARGVNNGAPFVYAFGAAFSSPPQFVVATQAGMDGSDGSWAYLFGSPFATSTNLLVAVDEDQVLDTDRSHTTEQVGYVAFETPVLFPPPSCTNDLNCDDGSFCNGAETCDVASGNCQPGTPIACDDGVSCTVDSCNEDTDTCDSSPDDGACDDGIFCNGVETCDPLLECLTGSQPCGAGFCDEVVDICPGAGPTARMEWGRVSAVGSDGTTVSLIHTYADPVVVASIEYSNNTLPVVARITNVTRHSFDVYLQNPSGNAVVADAVDYIVVERGTWTMDGVAVEAQKYTSTTTAHSARWSLFDVQTFGQTYSSPVVLGQVMSANDTRFSAFWSRGAARSSPPSPTDLRTGKMAGEDPSPQRADETIGFIVIEAGHGFLGGVEFEAKLGTDTVASVSNSPPYIYSFSTAFPDPPEVAVVTQEAMDGYNGGWMYTLGPNPTSETVLRLAGDEDQLADAERSRTTDQAGTIVFQFPGAYP